MTGVEAGQSMPFVPAPATLDKWLTEEWLNGIQIAACEEFETLSIETKHHKYEMTVVSPTTAEVLIRGGELFPKWTAATVCGASRGGSFLKLHGIYVDFKLELLVGGRHIITSRVRRIGVVSPD